MPLRAIAAVVCLTCTAVVLAATPPVLEGPLPGRQVFSPTNWWNQDVSAAPLDPQSAAFINFISGRTPSSPGATRQVHPDFGHPPDGDTYGGVARVSAPQQPTRDGV